MRERSKKMKLLLGYDGSDSSKKALAMVIKYAKVLNATVDIIISMISEQAPKEGITWRVPDDKEIDLANNAKAHLESAQKELEKNGIKAEKHFMVRGLEPGEDIVKLAKEINTDFIVMGIGKTSRVGKLFFGSNAQFAILEASCPVITVK